MLKRLNEILMFTLLGIFTVTTSILFIMYFSELFDDFRGLTIVFLIISIASLAGASIFLARWYNQRGIHKMIQRENKYAFGETRGFYNLSMFISKCDHFRRMRLNENKDQYVIALTASNMKIARNYQRDPKITTLNYLVADVISEIIRETEEKRIIKRRIFGCDKGTFFVYTIGDKEEELTALIEKIRDGIYKIAEEKEIRVWVEPIFGICKIDDSDDYLGESIDNAILARNTSERNFEPVTFYHESFRKSVNNEAAEEIIAALKKEEFVVYYQPKFNLKDKVFSSSEALVRWNSPKYGLLPPSKFIPVAEAAGLIHEIDTFVFKKVCEYLNETKRRGRRLLPVSVNFSLYEFFSIKFLDDMLNLLESYQIDPELIQIEITETTSQANQFLSVSIVKKLQDKGIKILMDDFGTGFSNIGNLRKLPFDVIKIDKSYIDYIHTDPKSADLVKFLIQLCQSNGMTVVAEGVDNAQQIELLKRFKCDEIQGFYYSKPLPRAEYDKFLVSNPFEVKEKREF